jgi:rfaE bifunctional protein nucleotidyltransferase chain/domain
MSLSRKCDSFAEAMDAKVIPPHQIEQRIAMLRSLGKTIATLNGSFDLVHAGHLEMVYQASKQADILILALNTDRSIQEYKSRLRPIIPLAYRLQMMAAIEMVDFVTWFDEPDPRHILSCIRPDVHVNGAEYGENCIEAPTVHSFGGKMHIVSLIPGFSTSQIIKKIKETSSCV